MPQKLLETIFNRLFCGIICAFKEKVFKQQKEKSMSINDKNFVLSDVEIETLRRAAEHRRMEFDPSRNTYSLEELSKYGLVREGYTKEEMKEMGVSHQVVSCFDDHAKESEITMAVDVPFGSGIRKWQIPVDMMPIRVTKTVFEKGSIVESHLHPMASEDEPGGGLRMIAKGSVEFEGRTYKSGDWFYVPNGTPYSFKTDQNEETQMFYTYFFFGAIEGNRFSHPHS